MTYKKLLLYVFFFSLLLSNSLKVFAADLYWVGGAGATVNSAGNWNTTDPGACNPGAGDAGAAPGSSDRAIFDADCDNNALIDLNWSVEGILINSGYTGTITQNTGNTLSIGNSNYEQNDGTFAGGDSNISISSGQFFLNGGTFTATSARFSISESAGNFDLITIRSAASFVHNNGEVALTSRYSSSGTHTHSINLDSQTIDFYDFTANTTNTNSARNLTLAVSSGTVRTLNDFTNNAELLTGGEYQVENGVFLQPESGGGYATVRLNGSGDQTISDNSGRFPQLAIDKTTGSVINPTDLTVTALLMNNGSYTAPSGTLFLDYDNVGADTNIFYKKSGLSFSHNNGTVAITGRSSSISGRTHSLEFDGDDVYFNDIDIDSVNTLGTRILTISAPNGAAIVGDTLFHNGENLGGLFQVLGDVDLGSSSTGGTGIVEFIGTVDQTISGSNGDLPIVEINKTSGSIFTPNNLKVTALFMYNGDFNSPFDTLQISESAARTVDVLVKNPGFNYYHRNGRVLFSSLGSNFASRTHSMDLNSLGFTFYDLDIVVENTSGVRDTTLDCGTENIIVLNGLTHDAERLNNCSFFVGGNYTVGTRPISGTSNLYFTGANGATFQNNGGVNLSGDIRVQKNGGSLTFLSNGIFNAASQDLFLQGGTLDIDSHDLTVNSNFEIHQGTTLQLDGSQTVSAPTSIENNTTVEYTGTAGSYSVENWDYYNLNISGLGGTFNLSADTDINGDLSILNGTLDSSLSDFDITLFGDWHMPMTSTFTPRAGLVTLDGTDQFLNGNISFNDLSKRNTSNDSTDETLTFSNGNTFTFSGTMTLEGLDSDDRVVLVSSDPGNQFTVNPTLYNLDFLSVTDSINSSTPLLNPPNSLDGGNNVNWFISDIPGMVGWYDASDASTITSDANGRVSVWNDKSGNGNNGTQAVPANQPLTGTQVINGLNVIEFDADNQYFAIPSRSDSRTVFAVLYEDGANPRNDFLGHSGGNSNRSYVRNSNPGFLWGSTGHPEYTNLNVISGTTRINSKTETGNTYFPPRDEAFMLSNLASGGVWVDQIARGKTTSSTTWRGNIAEIIIYNIALTNLEISQVENYLANKWGLDTNINVVSTYPAQGSDLNSVNNADHLIMNFNRDIKIGNGDISLYLNGGALVQTIDVNNGNAVSLDANNELFIQLDSSMSNGDLYYVQVDAGTVLNLNNGSYAGISNTTDWKFAISPSYSLNVNGLVGWWDAADTDTLTLDGNGRVSYWKDKSGDNRDAIQINGSARALSGTTTLGNLNTLYFDADGESYRMFENITNVRTAFMIMKEDSGFSANEMIGSFYQYSNSYESYRRDSAPGYIWGSTGHPEYISSFVTGGTTRVNSVTVAGQSSYLPNDEHFLLSNVTTGNVPVNLIGQRNAVTTTTWRGEIAEILLYDTALSSAEIGEVEDYLTQKWGLDIITDMFLENEFPPDNGALISPNADSIKLFLSKDALIQNGDVEIYQANGNIFETIDINNGNSVSGDGTDTMTLLLSRSFEQGASYYVNFDNGTVSDLAGNDLDALTGSSAWNFTIEPNYNFDINNLIGWWDAADTGLIETDVNGRVSYWNDKSGQNKPASQDDPTDRFLTGTTTQNGRNTVFFDADDQSMIFDQNFNNRTIVFVMEKQASTGSNQFFSHTDRQANVLESYSVDNSTFIWGSTGHPEYTHAPVISGTTKVNSLTVPGQSTAFPESRHYLFSNIATGNVPADQIGREASNTNTWRGEMAEILAYNISLTLKQLSRVEAYLADKWGFRLNYSSLNPVDNSTDVVTINDFTLNFDEAVDTQAADFYIYQSNGSIYETIDLSNGSLVTGNGTSSITINPVNDLVAGDNYYIHIEGGAFTDAANGSKAFTGMYENGDWNFSVIEPFDANGWTNFHRITVLASEVAADVREFPVYVDLGHLPSSFFSIVNGTGADIRMTQADQLREVAFELVDINTTNGTGELWFKAPFLSSSVDTDFYLFYGNGDAVAYADSDTYGAENVWTQGYIAVYHMQEDPTGTLLDSTFRDISNGSEGTMTTGDLVDGQLGKAIDFDGSDDHFIMPEHPDTKPNNVAVTIWIKPGLVNDAASPIVWDGGSADAYAFRFKDGGTPSLLGPRFMIREGGVTHHAFDNFSPVGNWYHLHGNYSSGAQELFVNGSLAVTNGNPLTSLQYPVFGSQSLIIGSYATGSSAGTHYQGSFDEIRVSDEVRSSSWVRTEYLNQFSPQDFYLIDGQAPGQQAPIFWFTAP